MAADCSRKIRLVARFYSDIYIYIYIYIYICIFICIYMGDFRKMHNEKFHECVCHPYGDSRWRSLLRHCATSRKVAVSIPDGVIEIFH